MNERLLAKSVFVVTTSELTEKGIAEEAEMNAAAQKEDLAVDLEQSVQYQIAWRYQKGPEELQQTKHSVECGDEELETVQFLHVSAEMEENQQKVEVVAGYAA